MRNFGSIINSYVVGNNMRWYQSKMIIASIIGGASAIIASLIIVLFSNSTSRIEIQIIPYNENKNYDKKELSDAFSFKNVTYTSDEYLTKKDSPPDTVLYLIDNSRSMIVDNSSVTRLKNIIIGDIGLLKKQDFISFMAFDRKAFQVLPFGNYEIQDVKNNIDKLRFDGTYTDILFAYEQAIKATTAKDIHLNKIVIVSDFIVDTPKRMASGININDLSLKIFQSFNKPNLCVEFIAVKKNNVEYYHIGNDGNVLKGSCE